MKRALLLLGVVGLTAALGGGCASLFSSGAKATVSTWNNFDEARAAFERIDPGKTTVTQLRALGFDPYSQPSVRILTYLDIVQHFIPNNSITLEDLPPPVRDCIRAQEMASAYHVDITVTRSQRHGNLFLDIFSFRRRTRETGWNFKALILINHDVVVYKLWSGQPHLESAEDRKRPLGPLQEIDATIRVPVF